MKTHAIRPTRGPTSQASRASQRGYTVVEVLSAMTLFAIGAAGVISMQRVTILGGDDARRMDVATNIAHEWTARLQRDAAFWTKPNPSDLVNTNLGDTAWLGGTKDVWTTPTQTLGYEGRSGSFDLYGRDRPIGSEDHIFCAQYRLSWITPQGAAAPFRTGASMRAEVRVFWARLDNAPIQKCEALAVAPDDASAKTYYHFVYATTAVRPNPIQ